jgi:hypothetical protein
MFNTKEGKQMKELQAYVERKNSWGKLFGSKALDLNSAKDRQAIASSIDCDLSPENLSCDGELSRSAVNARYTQLTRAAAQLQKLDPSVKFYEYA